ncbi:MAG: ATP-binding protein [Pseudomonadota bacterium]
MNLDMRTILIGAALSNAVCVVIAIGLWRQSRRRFAGTGYWVLDFALITGSLLLISGRGQLPDWLSIVVANVMAWSGALLGYQGLLHFAGVRRRQLLNIALIATLAVVHTLFTYRHPDLTVRTFNTALGLFVLCGQCAWFALRGAGPRMRALMRGVGLVFVAYALIALGRMIRAVVAPGMAPSYLLPDTVEAGIMLSYQVLQLALAFGLVLMVNRRLLGEVAAQEAKFAAAFRSSPYAITLTRPADGALIEVNEGFVQITGYGREDFLGQSSVGLGLWAEEAERTEVVRLLSVHGSVRDRECQFVHKSGQRITGLFSADVITVDGEPLILSSIADISERKAAEQERVRLQASLAQSDRMASMGMVAAGVAHEINNPLAYVLYNLESLADELPLLARALREGRPLALNKLDEAAQGAREAALGARRIREIAGALSSFARVEPNARASVDVRQAIVHALTLVGNELRYRARVVTEFAEVPPVLASEGKLAQVVLNLLLNAAHAMAEGDAEHNEVVVRCHADGDRVCIEVRDSGHGITAENLPRVFEPFFSTKGVGKGSGLGLTICKSIVEGFGGEIRVESRPGQGARFELRLPRAPDTVATVLPVQASPGSDSAQVPRGRILVVDDDAGVRKVLNRMLGPTHDLVLVATGVEARTLFEQGQRFDVILCDLMMSPLSGMELHGWLARRDPEQARRVVFITGGAFTPGALDYLQQANLPCVEKPFDTDALRALIEARLVASADAGPEFEGGRDQAGRVPPSP